jgi:hypothetical protein
MKPWEHDWHVDESGTLIRDERDYRIAEAIELDVPPQEYGNAKLAAAAPEMARLLIELHRHTLCPVCSELHTSHADGCDLLAVLRKAGVVT